MYQCLGLGSVEGGGCGEDWLHPTCVVGMRPDGPSDEQGTFKDTPRGESTGEHEADSDEPPPPPGFPDEDSFDGFICWKCVEAYPWIKRYAGTQGFLQPVSRNSPDSLRSAEMDSKTSTLDGSISIERNGDSSGGTTNKRKADNDDDDEEGRANTATTKKVKSSEEHKNEQPQGFEKGIAACRHKLLPPAPTGTLSLFFKADFRDQLCRCADCFPNLALHPQLLEEEETYEPPLSDGADDGNNDDHGAGQSSAGSGSLLDRGERALSNVDRVRAIGTFSSCIDFVLNFCSFFSDDLSAFLFH